MPLPDSDDYIFQELLTRYGSPDRIRIRAKQVEGRKGTDRRKLYCGAIFQVLEEYAGTNPGERLTQYQAIKRAKAWLAETDGQSCREVDDSTWRYYCKCVLPLYYSEGKLENMSDSEWKWLAKHRLHGKRSDHKSRLIDNVLQPLKELRTKTLQIRDLQRSRYGCSQQDDLPQLESQIDYWERVISLFS